MQLHRFKSPLIARTRLSKALMSTFTTKENPLLAPWTTEYELPPFSLIRPHHYKDAIFTGFAQHLEEVKAIAECPDEPTFENTIAVFDRAGGVLGKVLNVFHNQCSSNASPELQAAERELAAPLAEHENLVITFPGVFSRVADVYSSRLSPSSGLSQEQVRLAERVHLDFIRAGADLSPAEQEQYKTIVMRLAELTTQFAQNVLADEAGYSLALSAEQLGGLPEDLVAAARQAAQEREQEGLAITLSRSLVEPFLTYSEERELREEAWTAWTNRGKLDASRDNAPIIEEILRLRLRQAQMLGYESYAAYATADTMAKSTDRVMELLLKVWEPAKAACTKEKAVIQQFMQEQGEEARVRPWDWRFYAEKIRQRQFELDAAELKPYFSLPSMCEALFDCAHRLFGLKFVLRADLASYHPDVQIYEVWEEEGEGGGQFLRAIFLHDNFSRSNKQGGAWMSEYRSQCRNFTADVPEGSGAVRTDVTGRRTVVPVIVNNNNFCKAPEGHTTLLSFDDAVTLFHEFGHGLHGMLSDVTYQRLAGTNVLRDFVELPSQLFEHWLSQPEVLRRYACHHETGEPIPEQLVERLKAAQNFNNGFDTVEYLSSALVDQSLHQQGNVPETFSVSTFEDRALAKLGMPEGMVMRHRPTHFLHLFSCSSYAAAYYVYLWAEVLDADGFDAFLETGDVFDQETAARVRRCIYSSGNSVEPGEAFRSFRGRDPEVAPMLRKKGLLQ